MQQGVIRMRLDGRIDGPAFKARAGEVQAAQFPFENTEATVFGGLHPFHLRVGRGINLAKLDQEVPQVALETGRACSGEDVAHDGWLL